MCRTDHGGSDAASRGGSALSEPLLEVSTRQCPNTEEQQPEKPSRNIKVILAYTFFAFAGRALWCQSVLSTYIYLLRGDNPEAVGFMTAVMGLSQLVASVPSGILSDQHRRDVALKVASVVGILAISLTLLSVLHENYKLLILALAVWGCVWGIANTCLAALFADSIPDGDRSFYFTRRAILIKLGNTMGPLAALVLFAVLGDSWTLHDCAFVMAVGQIVSLPGVLLLCFPSDNDVVNTEDDPLEQPDEILSEALLLGDVNLSFDNLMDSDNSEHDTDDNDEHTEDVLMTSDVVNLSVLSEATTTLATQPSQRVCGCIPQERIIPVLVSLADVISGLASGMSIRYFPIFFLDNLRLSPVMVQILFLVSPLTGTVLAHVGQAWSRRIGRCVMTCIYKWIGIACMVVMILSYQAGMPVWLVCVLYLMRTSFMNSTTALTKSVLMDAVPKHERGKWSALESVNMFSWSGSAALGGILVGYKGLLFNFCITASLQLLATVPLVLLFSKETMEEELAAASPGPTTTTSSSATSQTDKERPHFTNDSRFKV